MTDEHDPQPQPPSTPEPTGFEREMAAIKARDDAQARVADAIERQRRRYLARKAGRVTARKAKNRTRGRTAKASRKRNRA